MHIKRVTMLIFIYMFCLLLLSYFLLTLALAYDIDGIVIYGTCAFSLFAYELCLFYLHQFYIPNNTTCLGMR